MSEFSPSLSKRGHAEVPGWSCKHHRNSPALVQEKEDDICQVKPYSIRDRPSPEG